MFQYLELTILFFSSRLEDGHGKKKYTKDNKKLVNVLTILKGEKKMFFKWWRNLKYVHTRRPLQFRSTLCSKFTKYDRPEVCNMIKYIQRTTTAAATTTVTTTIATTVTIAITMPCTLEEEKKPDLLKLFDYQKEAVYFLQRMKSQCEKFAVLDMEMGLGKTIVSLSFATKIAAHVLFITQKSIIPQINADTEKYFKDKDVTIINSYNLKNIAQKDFADTVLIIDECHMLKKRSKFGKWLLENNDKFNFIIGLSGTFNLGVFFMSLFEGSSLQQVYTKKLCQLKHPPFVVPNCVDVNITLNSSETIAYKSAVALAKQQTGHALKTIHAFKNIRKVLSLSEGKVAAIKYLLKRYPEKFVIFSEFNNTLSMLRIELASICNCLVFFGNNYKKRQESIDVFENTNKGRVLLCNSNIAAHGISLTSALHCVCIEPTYTEALLKQLSARICRIGQLRKPTIWRLNVQGTLESKLHISHIHADDMQQKLIKKH